MPLTPVHCPPENDVGLDLGDAPACSPGHRQQRASLEAAAGWLGAAGDALGDGSLADAGCPHLDGSGTSLRFSGIDPQCLAVVLAQGVAGRFYDDAVQDADAVYIGLCAQQPSGRWQGLAGVFVWLCGNCAEPDDP